MASPAAKARLNQPQSVAVDGAGNLLIADTGNDRVRVVAHNTGTFYGRPMIGGHIYTVAGTGKAGFSGDGGPAAKARLSQPRSVAVGGAGNLLIADTGNYRVRVVVRRAGTFYGRPMAAGHIYTVAGDRHLRVLRRWRPGHQGRARRPVRSEPGRHRGSRRRGQPADRRRHQRPDPGGGAPDR